MSSRWFGKQAWPGVWGHMRCSGWPAKLVFQSPSARNVGWNEKYEDGCSEITFKLFGLLRCNIEIHHAPYAPKNRKPLIEAHATWYSQYLPSVECHCAACEQARC